MTSHRRSARLRPGPVFRPGLVASIACAALVIAGCGGASEPIPRPPVPAAAPGAARAADIAAGKAKEPALCGASTPAPAAVTLPRMTVAQRSSAARLSLPTSPRSRTAAHVRSLLTRSGQDGFERAGSAVVALLEDPPARYAAVATARTELTSGLTRQGEQVLSERTRLATQTGWPRRWDAASTRYTATLNGKKNVGVFTQVGLLRVAPPAKEASTIAPWQVRRVLMAWDGRAWRTVCLSAAAPVFDLPSDTASTIPKTGSRLSVVHTWQRYVGAR